MLFAAGQSDSGVYVGVGPVYAEMVGVVAAPVCVLDDGLHVRQCVSAQCDQPELTAWTAVPA